MQYLLTIWMEETDFVPTPEAMELMLKNMKATKTNVEFFDMMRRGG